MLKHPRSFVAGLVCGLLMVAVAVLTTGCGSAVSIKAGSNRASETITTLDPATGLQRTHTRTVEAEGGVSTASGDEAANVKAGGDTGPVTLDPLGGASTGGSMFSGKASATSEAVRWLLWIACIGCAGMAVWSLYRGRLPCAFNYAISSAALGICIWLPSVADLVLVIAILYSAGHTEYAGQLLTKAKARAASLFENTKKMTKAVSDLEDSTTKTVVKKAMSAAGVDEKIIAEAKAVK